MAANDKEDCRSLSGGSDNETTVTSISDLTLFGETEGLQSAPSEAQSLVRWAITLSGKRKGLGCCSEMVKACFVVCA